MIFSAAITEKIDAVFQQAWNDGRGMLFEWEVYRVLDAIGLETPKFAFVKSPDEVGKELLQTFGRMIVVKIVSSQIAHKQRLGGVKVIRNLETLFVQFVLSRMREEVLAHFSAGEQPGIEGFLIVEFVPHTQALGYEVLIGFKEDAAFGPVMTISKGGDDAEFFAKYFDPANLFLPPLDKENALHLFNGLHIKHKFDQIGHSEYMSVMAHATSVLSRLAQHYSAISRQSPPFVIKALDINPFVIAEDNRFLAIDGFCQFEKIPWGDTASYKINREGLESFFQPDGIAVVGVSADEGKYSLGREIARLMHELGRTDLFLINARGGTLTLDGTEYILHTDLTKLPRPVDLVVYCAPAQYMLESLAGLDSVEAKAVIAISGIPSDIHYTEFAEGIHRSLPKGIRVIGPNCMGVFYAPDGERKGLNTFFVEEARLEIKSTAASNTVLLTQSGALAVTAVDKMQNSKVFRSIVSFGNKLDVKMPDLLAYFAERSDVDLLALYIEGLDPGEGREFFEYARQIRKPVVVYKAGRTEAGARAAASHTASLSGSYEVFKAASGQAGIVRAETIEDFYDYIKVFSLLARRLPGGNRVAGVVNAGFESTIGADELRNLSQAKLGEETLEKLKTINRSGLVDVHSPFLDITPMADDRMYAEFVEALLQDDGVDCVFVAVIPHTVSLKTSPDTCRDSDSLGSCLCDLSQRYTKPIVVSVNAGRYYQDFVALLEQCGLPVYNDIRAAIGALDAFAAFHLR